jgi:hypothetical protein
MQRFGLLLLSKNRRKQRIGKKGEVQAFGVTSVNHDGANYILPAIV